MTFTGHDLTAAMIRRWREKKTVREAIIGRYCSTARRTGRRTRRRRGRRTWYAREKGRGERTGFLERTETVIGGGD